MRKLLLSGLFVSIALFLGRISGFLREIIIASLFGASQSSDIAILLLSIPDLLVSLLVGGALSVVIIPEFDRLSKPTSDAFYLQVLYFLGVIFLFLSFLLSFFSKELIHIFAPGISENVIDSVSFFLKISLLSIPLTVLSGVTTSRLNYKGKFLVPALGSFIFNCILVVSLLFFKNQSGGDFLYFLTFGILLASFFRWFVFLWNDGFYLYDKSFFSSFLIRFSLVRKYAYSVFCGGFLFLIPVIVRAIASTEGKGYLSISSYALKLIDLPLAVFLSVFSIIFLPKLSSLSLSGDKKGFDSIFWLSISLILFFSIVITFSTRFFSFELSSLIYGFGAISNDDLHKISALVSIATLSLFFQGVNSFLVSAHASKGDTFTPFLITTFVLILFFFTSRFFDLSLVYVFYLMDFSYFLISILLLFNVFVKHKVSITKQNINLIFHVFFASLVSVGFLSFFSAFEINIFLIIFLIALALVFGVVLLFFLNKDVRGAF